MPQGSVLGPPIFCSYIASYSALSPVASVVKYADDVTLVIPFNSSSPIDISDMINEEVDNFSSWCSSNKLTLNSAKSKYLLITRRPIVLENSLDIQRVSSIRLLGVYFNDKLSWDNHVDHLRVTCSHRLHILRKLNSLISINDLHVVYSSLVRSMMDYACPLFVGLSERHATILRRLESRAHRIMFHGQRSSCCPPNSLKERRLLLSSRLWDKIKKDKNHLLHPLLPQTLPVSKRYSVPSHRTDKFARSFFVFMTLFLNNSLP